MNIFRHLVMQHRDSLPPVRERADGVLVLAPGFDFREPDVREPGTPAPTRHPRWSNPPEPMDDPPPEATFTWWGRLIPYPKNTYQ